MNRPGWFAWFLTAVGVICMAVPLAVVVVSSFNDGTEIAVPPHGFSLRWYANAFQRERFLHSLQFSLVLAAISTALSLIIGLMCSVALMRHRFPGRELVAALINSPLIVPQVVMGMALLVLLANAGLASSFLGLGILHLILTLPYTVKVLSASLLRFPQSLEDAAIIHGAHPVTAFVRVTIPCVKPAMVAAAIFAFVTSFDNFTATQFLVWDRTTLPVEIYSYAMLETDPTVCAISAMLIALTTVVVLAIERWAGLEMVTG
ncbi:ABC transporter permease [Bradyrhizobium sp. NP1]|uniref:ABC transporter permease n=1 Tax=Bradyrhizobium sp. NP1 TaxID=3049772 RepID=UPI0025A5C0A1|nr:ABC transporter permease [Bradyrhizobium sp. NP1]WJR74991.1 ABC transporter permease [Bradyrhizobium sp. NP1]